MQLISVNIGKSEPISSKTGQTGIFKKPQSGPVQIERLGPVGDTIIDTKNHGGRDQAVYLYGQPDYDWWSTELGQDLAPGTFGENLTVTGLESATINIGDRFIIGDCVLETTSPRIPCNTFAIRMGDPQFLKAFMMAKRPGVYCRVITTGKINQGDSVVFEPFDGTQVLINELLNYKNLTREMMAQILQTPVHYKQRASYEAKLSADS